MNRRKFLSYIGCGCCGFILPSCTTAPITNRNQLKIIPESKLNAQAAQQNRINQENFQRQQQGLKDLADIFRKMGEGNSGQQMQEKPEKVCVYRCNFDTVTTTEFICPFQITYKGSVCYLD